MSLISIKKTNFYFSEFAEAAAGLGGKSAHASGMAHKCSSEEGSIAGAIGGKAPKLRKRQINHLAALFSRKLYLLRHSHLQPGLSTSPPSAGKGSCTARSHAVDDAMQLTRLSHNMPSTYILRVVR